MTGIARVSGAVRIAACALAVAAGSAQGAGEECAAPVVPTIPDGATASAEAMSAAGSRVRAFVADSQVYLTCLEAKEASYGDAITPQQKAVVDAVYNAGVDAMQNAAEAYNAAVRAYNDADGE